MSAKILNFLLVTLFVIGIGGAGMLVYQEFTTHNACPKILHVPVCYVVLFSFVIPFLVHVFKKKPFIYFAFASIGFGIAAVASTMQLFSFGNCPQTDSGIPMCYLSLALFSSLIVLKGVLVKSDFKNG